MSTKFQFKSLKVRLTFWFLAVTVLSLTTVVTLIYFQRASAIRDEEFVKLQVVRDLKVMQLSNWIDQRIGDLEVIAGDVEIQVVESISTRNGGELDPSTLSVARSLLQRYLDHYDAYKELFVISAPSGEVAVSTDTSRQGSDKSTDLYFTEPLRTRQSYIKDVYYSETERDHAMAFPSQSFA
jgi:hypothetical protein